MQRLALLTLLTAAALAQTPARQIVLAADRNSLEPIVVVENGELVAPFDSLDADDLARKATAFLSNELKPGTTYRLLKGGKATVTDNSMALTLAKDLGTTGGAFTSGVSAKVEPPGQGLAINYPPPERPTYAPDKQQLTAALRKLLPKGKLTGAIARDLDHDGVPEYLGTGLQGKVGAMVIVQNGRTVFQRKGNEVDVLDSLNLVGDATDEVVIRNAYYENWDFEVLGLKNGKWISLFKGSGGGS